jgi:hypothetical protein
VARAIRGLYAIADQAVEDQLAGQLDQPAPRVEPEPEPDRYDTRAGATNTRAATERNRRTGGMLEAGVQMDRPENARQLLGMLHTWKESTGTDFQGALLKWAKRSGLPWRILAWEPDQVAEATEFLGTLRPKPAAVNGHTNGR